MKHTASPYHAQFGEDRIAARIFQKIGVTNRIAVEFGADDGMRKSNTAYFRLNEGWQTWLFDAEPTADTVHLAHITAENVNEIFAASAIPHVFDLLSIDIDGNDLWVWQALIYAPRLVIIEYNPRWRPRKSRVVPYDPAFIWDRTDYYGASVSALVRLGRTKGYTLAASTRTNLIFVQRGLFPEKSVGSVRRAIRRKQADPFDRVWERYQ